MKNDRFLYGILIFIGLLVLAALVVFFTGNAAEDYRAETGPEDIVHNYALAVTLGDYARAYGYLAEGEHKPTEAEFRSQFIQYDPLQNVGLRVDQAQILEGEAIVGVSVVYGGSGPFDSGYSSEETAILEQQNGVWKIKQMPYPYWNYDWLDGTTR